MKKNLVPAQRSALDHVADLKDRAHAVFPEEGNGIGMLAFVKRKNQHLRRHQG
jgi:hypothetical protein